MRKNKKNIKIGIIDADLIDNGTRHPNLALMKIAGYLRDHEIPYSLILSEPDNINEFTYIFMSKVFTFSKEPNFLAYFKKKPNIFKGGTGYYAEEEDFAKFINDRSSDMSSLEKNELLLGFSMARQMPDYHLYDGYIETEVNIGRKITKFIDYEKFSIGFLTRGCIRKCPFCVNKNIDSVTDYSDINDFLDVSRPRIYLWDDNILASKNWRIHLESLMATGKSFQFRQGLDIRLMTKEKAEILSKCSYYGDYIFAFDQIRDKEIIEKKLKIWKEYGSHKTTKFYLFCGYEIGDDNSLITDIINIFVRVEVLMKNGCLGYVMRHEDYRNHLLCNIYVQIARWCNQPQFYKKMSFKEFIDRNQYWTKTDNDCMSMKTYKQFMSHFDHYEEQLNYYFNMKYDDLNNK